MSGFQTIVAALTSRFHSRCAGSRAGAGGRSSSHVHLLHAVPSAVPPLWTDEPSTLDPRPIEQAWIDAAQAAGEASRAARHSIRRG
jgi:hypothetical protein